MEFNLSLPYDNEIEEADKTAIESYIEATIEEHKDNAQMLTKFAMEASFALTAGESRASGLASQGFFKNIWGGITGKNRKIRGEIDYNFAVGQRASQQMIKTLAKQNKLTFDAVANVSSKLNMIHLSIEEELNEMHTSFGKEFDSIKSSIVKNALRIDKLESSVNLQQLESTLEYLEYDGVNYKNLPTEEKIFCLVNDFLVATQNNYSHKDIFMLKPILTKAGIDIDEKASLSDFYKAIIKKPALLSRVFENFDKEKISNLESYIISIFATTQKLEKLNGEEIYIVNTICSMTDKKEEDVKLNLLKEYIKQEASLDIDNKNNNYFEIALMLISELSMINNSSSVEASNNKIPSENVSNLLEVASTLIEAKHYEAAIIYCDKIITLDPNHVNAYYKKGRALGNLGRYEEAIKCYDKAIEIDPNYLDAYKNKGNALNELGRYEEAIKCYDRITESK